jgi:hypothetical protein
MGQSVAAGLAGEAVVALVESIVVDAAQALRTTVAELRRPLSASIARRHCFVESSETASRKFLTCLRLQILVSAVLRVVTFECGWVMCRICMSGRGSVRITVVNTRIVLWIGMRVALRLRLGFHVDSSAKIRRRS